MRVDRLNQLADALEAGLPGVKFDLREWREELSCGTAACIAGHAAILAGLEGEGSDAAYDAADWLGLANFSLMSDPDNIGRQLFMPKKSDADYAHITAPMAARVVRHLAKTGEVDWSVARKEGDGE